MLNYGKAYVCRHNKFTSAYEIKRLYNICSNNCFSAEITYYLSSGQISTLLTTLKVVHNETNNSTETNYPKNVSGPIHHSQNAHLQTSIAVLSGIILLLLCVHFSVYVRQKLYEKKNVFQNFTA